jgi:hypothetical protein
MATARARLPLLLTVAALATAGCPENDHRTRGDDTSVRAAPELAPPRPAPPDLAPDRPPDTPPPAPVEARKPAAPKPALRPAAPAEATGPAVATLGKVGVKGDLPRPEVERLVRGRLPAFRACYASELEKDAHLKGRMLLELTVEPTGGVSLADVKTSTLGSSAADLCVGKAARDLHFRSRPGAPPVIITFPLDLHRGS